MKKYKYYQKSFTTDNRHTRKIAHYKQLQNYLVITVYNSEIVIVKPENYEE